MSAAAVVTRSPAAAVAAYIAAKDANRPHLIDAAFADGAVVEIDNRTEAIAFPSRIEGRGAIADALVRGFAARFENVYTFCLTHPPAADIERFGCGWLVAMSEKGSGAARVGHGRYEWTFAVDGRTARLVIVIERMTTLAGTDAAAAIRWAAALPYPWCPPSVALGAAPETVRRWMGDALG